MNTLDEQITLIQAHKVQRAIQCRTTDVVNDKDLVWIPITKDHRFNFQDYEYRLAPVTDECWLVYDHQEKRYLRNAFSSANDAAQEALFATNEGDAGRFVPVHMTPTAA